MKFYIFLSILGIILFLANQVSALDQYNAFQNIAYNLQVPCSFNGYFCPSTSSCNVSVVLANSTQVVANQQMTIKAQYANYTFTSSNLQTIGTDLGTVLCTDTGSGLNSSYQFNLRVTQTGTDVTLIQGIMYIASAFIILIILVFSFVGGVSIPWSNTRSEEGAFIGINELKYLKLFLLVMSYILFLSFSYLCYQITQQFLDFNAAGTIFSWIYNITLYLFWPIVVVAAIVGFVAFVYDRKLNFAIRRGIPFRE